MAEQPLTIGDGTDWTFVGGPWSESDDGVILPPPTSRQYGPQNFQAFSRGVTAGDLEADFEFRINGLPSFCEPRFIFRAQDPARYYAVGFPAVGQSWRAKAMWAAIWRLEANGMHHLLAMRQVLGVVAEHGRWYKGHVSCVGSRFSFSIDGREIVSASDGAYAAGRVGLGAWGPAEFRNVRLVADGAPADEWDDSRRTAEPWFFPLPADDESVNQCCHTVRRLPSGRLLMWMDHDGEVLRLTSDNAGRTWGEPQLTSAGGFDSDWESLEGSLAHFVLPDGRVKAMYQPTSDARETYILESPDEGLTFAEPKRVAINGDWPRLPDRWLPYSLMVTPAGEILRFCYTEPLPHTKGLYETPGGGGTTWAGVTSQAYSMRSTDGGNTWSAPASLDGMWWPGAKHRIEPNFDATEPAACIAPDGRICCMIRPISSPLMWQTWSNDGGQSWEPSAFGPFPGYQCGATQTTSGAMVFCMRFPCITVYVSHDGGATWKGTMIDYAAQGPDPGGVLEVEPDVVLITYRLVTQPARARAQRLRITPDGVEPA